MVSSHIESQKSMMQAIVSERCSFKACMIDFSILQSTSGDRHIYIYIYIYRARLVAIGVMGSGGGRVRWGG